MFYDPMIAKLCTWGKNRETAVTAMSHALDAFEVEGIGHNLPFCAAVMKHERFKSGNITTAFIEEEYPDGFEGVAPSDVEVTALAAISAAMKLRDERRNAAPATPDNKKDYVVVINGQSIPLSVQADDAGYEITLADDGSSHHIGIDYTPGIPLVRANADKTDYIIKTAPITGGYRLRMQGLDLNVKVYTPRIAELASLMLEKLPPDTSKLLLCPMPGLIVKLNVQKGDKIEEGQALAIVEAMKMENVLRAEKAGVVSKIPVAVGDSLAVDEVIMEFEE
jgi:propionyl-CoA carboxylase alpha chain